MGNKRQTCANQLLFEGQVISMFSENLSYFQDLLTWKSKDHISKNQIHITHSVPLTAISHFVPFKSLRKKFSEDE